MLQNLIFVGIGGFFGSISRYLVYLATDWTYHKTQFPLGTLLVNALGSLIIGILFALSVKHSIFGRHTVLHYLFITGFLGAFTTFSTFSQDNLVLIFNKNYLYAGINTLASITLGIGFAGLGYFLVERYF